MTTMLIKFYFILGSNETSIPNKKKEEKSTNVLLVILISMLTFVIAAGGGYVIYQYWQKRKRERDHARFLKLFDEGDDIEDELGLEPL